MPEIYLLGGHMKDMKDRVRRAVSAVAVREHWRMRRVLLLVMVAVTALSMVTVKSMGDTVQPRRVYVVLTEDGRTEITVEPKTASSPVPLAAEDQL